MDVGNFSTADLTRFFSSTRRYLKKRELFDLFNTKASSVTKDFTEVIKDHVHHLISEDVDLEQQLQVYVVGDDPLVSRVDVANHSIKSCPMSQ
jgi:hypothetical protein